MISDLKQSILYLCTNCTHVTRKEITAFDFSQNKAVGLACDGEDCKNESVSIKLVKDKYKILVNCPVCCEKHLFTISARTMWQKDFFILNCPLTGFGIFYLGKDEKRLYDEYKMQNDLAAGILATEDFDEDELDLLLDVFERINELSKNNAISCKCGSDRICAKINEDGIILSCSSCGYEKKFEISYDFLEELITSEHFII